MLLLYSAAYVAAMTACWLVFVCGGVVIGQLHGGGCSRRADSTSSVALRAEFIAVSNVILCACTCLQTVGSGG